MYSYSTPAWDYQEDGNLTVLEVDLPGVSKKDIEVEVKDRILSVRAQRKGQSITKQFTLSRELDEKGIEAATRDGVLYLKIPRREEMKPRSIPVSSG